MYLYVLMIPHTRCNTCHLGKMGLFLPCKVPRVTYSSPLNGGLPPQVLLLGCELVGMQDAPNGFR